MKESIFVTQVPLERLPGTDDLALPAYATAGAAGLDLVALATEMGIDVAAQLEAAVPGSVPPEGLSWTIDFELRQWSPPAFGPVDLCATHNLNADLPLGVTLNGTSFADCPALSIGDNGLSHWLMAPEEPLSCSLPWHLD